MLFHELCCWFTLFGATTQYRATFNLKVHLFSGSFGSAVDENLKARLLSPRSIYLVARLALVVEQLRNTGPLLRVHLFSGSFGSAVNERTRNNLYAR